VTVPSPKGHPCRELAKRGTFRSEEVSVESLNCSSAQVAASIWKFQRYGEQYEKILPAACRFGVMTANPFVLRLEPVAASSKPGYNEKRDDAADGLYGAC
jgi:hypothetical protein